jgi:hypothetical protein
LQSPSAPYLVVDWRVEIGGEEEPEEFLERGRRRRRRRPGDEAGDAVSRPGGRECGEDAVGVGGRLALDLGEEAAEAMAFGGGGAAAAAAAAAVGEVGGADVGRRLRVGGSELAGEAHAVLVRVAPHLPLLLLLLLLLLARSSSSSSTTPILSAFPPAAAQGNPICLSGAAAAAHFAWRPRCVRSLPLDWLIPPSTRVKSRRRNGGEETDRQAEARRGEAAADFSN